MSEKFGIGNRGLLCPWCPKKKDGSPVFISDCEHNPFALNKRINELQEQLWRLEKVENFISILKEIVNE